jgi:hypothetical protein
MQGGLLSYLFHFQGTAERVVQAVAAFAVIQMVMTNPEGLARVAGHLRWRRRPAAMAEEAVPVKVAA